MSVGGVHQQGGSGDRVVDAPLEAETASTTAERDRDEVGQQCVWEEELVSQRDVSVEVVLVLVRLFVVVVVVIQVAAVYCCSLILIFVFYSCLTLVAVVA